MPFKQLYAVTGLVAAMLLLGGCYAEVDSDYYVIGDPELGTAIFYNNTDMPVHIIADPCDHAFHIVTKVKQDDGGNCDDDHKVAICHVPPGNPDNEHTIMVGEAAAQKHIDKHGDRRGACDNDCDDDSADHRYEDDDCDDDYADHRYEDDDCDDDYADHRYEDDDCNDDSRGDDSRHRYGFLYKLDWRLYPAFDPEYPECEGDFSLIRIEAGDSYKVTFDPGSFDPGLYRVVFAVGTRCEDDVVTPQSDSLPRCAGILPIKTSTFEVNEVGITPL